MSQSKVELPGAHGLYALIPRGRNSRGVGFPIGLLFSEDPVRGFGQMPGDGSDGLLMAFAPSDAFVEATDVAARPPAAIEADRVGGFDERPLEIVVDVGAGRSEASLAAAGVDARRGACVGRELLGGGEPRTGADFKRDHDGERKPDPGEGQEQLNGGRWFAHGLDLVFEPTHRTVQALDLLEQLAGGVRRAWRQEIEALPQQSAASRPEEIAHLQVVEAVLRQGGVNAILESRALPDEYHPGPRQVALVAQLAWGDPDCWECAGALELIEPSDVELIGLVDLSHHQFRLTGVDQFGHAARGLDLVDDPIPIANGLDRHRGAALTALEKLLERPALVRDALFADELAVGPGHG